MAPGLLLAYNQNAIAHQVPTYHYQLPQLTAGVDRAEDITHIDEYQHINYKSQIIQFVSKSFGELVKVTFLAPKLHRLEQLCFGASTLTMRPSLSQHNMTSSMFVTTSKTAMSTMSTNQSVQHSQTSLCSP